MAAESGVGSSIGLDDFMLLRVIGRGSYAKVFVVEQKSTKRVYAMKVIKKELVNDDEVWMNITQLNHDEITFSLQ